MERYLKGIGKCYDMKNKVQIAAMQNHQNERLIWPNKNIYTESDRASNEVKGMIPIHSFPSKRIKHK